MTRHNRLSVIRTYIRQIQGAPMLQSHQKWIIGIGAAVVCLVAGLVFAHFARAPVDRPAPGESIAGHQTPTNEPGDMDGISPGEDAGIPVKTVRPKRDPGFKATIEQPAYVNAYYQDDLQARAAGPVKYLKVSIGERVTKGQTPLVVDVPDVAQEVAQKAAIIKQREREQEVADAGVRVAQSYAKAKEAWCDFKFREYGRFKKLAMPPNPAVTGEVVDERWKDYLTAEAEKMEATEKVAMARADVELKKAMVVVAKEDHKRSQEILNL